MTEIIKLFELEIDVERAVQDTRATKIAIEQLKEESKRLKETEGELSDAFIESQASLKVLQNELRQNEKITQNVIQANEANTGSVDQLRKQLAIVSVQWAKLSKDERENTDLGKKLTAQKTQLTESLKKEERATGDARRNVGNYNEALSKSIGIFGQFAPVLNDVSSAAGTMGKAFTAALGPIGLVLALIALVIAALKAFFTSSEEGQNAWTRFAAVGSAVIDKLTDGLAAFGKRLLEPKKMLDELRTLFELTFGKILKGVLESARAYVDKFFLNFNLGFQKLKGLFTDNAKGIEETQARINAANVRLQEGNKLIVQGVTNTKIAFNAATGAIKDFIDETNKAALAAQGLADKQAKLDKQIRGSIVANAADQEKIAKLRNDFAKKDQFNDQQRLTILDQIFKLEKGILDRNLSIAQQKYNITKAQNDLSDKTKEDLDEEANLLAEVYNVRKTNFERTKELEAQRSDLVLKMKNEALQAEIALAKAEVDRRQKEAEQDLEALNNAIQFDKERDLAQAQIEEQAAQRRLVERDAEFEATKKNVFRTLALKAEELEIQRRAEIDAAERIGADTFFIEQKYANATLELEKSKTDAKLALAEGFAGNLKTIFGEQTAIGKAAAIAETTINTYRGATAAYSALAGIPVIGPALGIAAAAAAIAAGLRNVKQILAVKSGLPEGGTGTPSGISSNAPGATQTNAAFIAPSVNSGIVSRETVIGNNENTQGQSIIVVDSVTAAQMRQKNNSKTAVI